MKTRVWAGAALAALALVLAVTACGSGEDEDGGAQVASLDETATTTTTGSDDADTAASDDPQEAALAFARCMRERGIDVPDPQNGRIVIGQGPGAGGAKPSAAERKKFEEAQRACAEHLEGVRPQLSEEDRAELQEAMLAYARCMREHGVEVPDPTFNGQGGGFRMRLESRDDPDFEEAQEACESHLQVLEDIRPRRGNGS
jgi:hypothetical protein